MFVGSGSHPFGENHVPRGVKTFSRLVDVVSNDNNIGIGNGVLVGITNTTSNAIAFGQNVGADPDTASKSISIGSAFGSPFTQSTSQDGIGSSSIAIGSSANGNAGANLGQFSVMIGAGNCYNGCSDDVVAIGKAVGATNPPSSNAILIGSDSGSGTTSSVESNSICIGNQAGVTGCGENSILIGHSAQGLTDNSIVVNATGNPLSAVADGLVISPIEEQTAFITLENHINLPSTATGFTQILVRNPTTSEIRAVTLQTIP